MFDQWFNNFTPDAPTVCLKYRLKPYCLGHDILINRIASPLASFDLIGVSPKDLLAAVLICSQSYEEGEKSLRSPWLGLLLRVWRIRLRQTNWFTETEKFIRYRTNGMWMPETCPPAKGRTLDSPWQFRLAAQLMEKFNLTESQALNLPLVRAHIYYAAIGDVEGSIKLYGEKEAAMSRKLDEIEGRAE